MWRAILIAVAIDMIACGRIAFDERDPRDAALGDSAEDAPARPNVAFTTRTLFDAAFGGLAGADAVCANQATAAGLPGTFIALLSTTAIDARDRLAGSRGWVDTQGHLVADQPADLLVGGRAFGVLFHDASGALLPSALVYVWTGTTANGILGSLGACGDWTSTAGSANVGFYARSAPGLIDTGPLTCATQAHLYCFEVGNNTVVEPMVAPGRIAFISKTPTGSTLGISGYDAQCQTEANAAGLPGTYLAALATTTSSIASRFGGTTPWRRVDGIAVSSSAAHMFDTVPLLATVNQEADGTYLSRVSNTLTRTGATNPNVVGTAASTCDDWTATTSTMGMSGAAIEATKTGFWANGPGFCTANLVHVCMQQ